MTMYVRIPNYARRQKELDEVKTTYGVTGFTFYRRPCVTLDKWDWCCSRMRSSDDNSIELATTKAADLQALLDGLLNIENGPILHNVIFGRSVYNNLEDLWKAMGKI
jgi:hypothetical protein